MEPPFKTRRKTHKYQKLAFCCLISRVHHVWLQKRLNVWPLMRFLQKSLSTSGTIHTSKYDTNPKSISRHPNGYWNQCHLWRWLRPSLYPVDGWHTAIFLKIFHDFFGSVANVLESVQIYFVVVALRQRGGQCIWWRHLLICSVTVGLFSQCLVLLRICNVHVHPKSSMGLNVKSNPVRSSAHAVFLLWLRLNWNLTSKSCSYFKVLRRTRL